jgi:hypothetical protein
MQPRSFLLTLAVVFFLPWTAYAAPAANVYIASSAAGSGTGADCSDALPVSFFNDGANWGTNAKQIGPATTVHLCGTLDVGVGNTLLTAQGAGASGSPITILFEPGAGITSPGMGTGIELGSYAHFVIDGGTTCGYVGGPGSTDVTCNGYIENTANGDGLANQVLSAAIRETGGDIEVRNLLISNLYVAKSGVMKPSFQPYPVCVYFAGAAPGLNFHNNIAHDLDWCLNGDADDVVMANNDIYDMDHGVGMGSGPGTTHTGLVIHDNHMHDTANWDTPNNAFHHDGIHTYWLETSHIAFSGALIYDNLYDGLWGANNTGMAEIWDHSNATVFNNVHIGTDHLSDGLLDFSSPEGGPDNAVYGNTIQGCGTSCQSGTALQLGGQSGGGVMAENNLVTTADTIVTTQAGIVAPFHFSNNLYANAGGSEPFYNGGYDTFAQWQTAFGELGSMFVSDAMLGTNGVPQAASPAIGAGANLSKLCTMNGGTLPNALCEDVLHRPRPSSGPWDIGAYQHCPSSGCPEADAGRDADTAPRDDGGDAGGGHDAGTSGGGHDSGASAGHDGDSAHAPEPPSSSGACGCRVAPRHSEFGAVWGLGLAALMAARRRLGKRCRRDGCRGRPPSYHRDDGGSNAFLARSRIDSSVGRGKGFQGAPPQSRRTLVLGSIGRFASIG